MFNLFNKKHEASTYNFNPIIIDFCETLGFCSGGLCEILQPYYKKRPHNPDEYIWDAFGFLLAYIYEQDGIDQNEVIVITKAFSTNFTFNKRFDAKMYASILQASQFYSQRFFDMNRTKSHTMPDVIVYNLLRPLSFKPFSSINIMEVDILEVSTLWASISDFLKNIVIPQINIVLEKM